MDNNNSMPDVVNQHNTEEDTKDPLCDGPVNSTSSMNDSHSSTVDFYPWWLLAGVCRIC